MGAPASMQKLGLKAPLVGYLMQARALLSGGTMSLKGTARPVAEPEISMRMASDLRFRRVGRGGDGGDQRFGHRNRRSRCSTSGSTISTPCWQATSTTVMSCCAATRGRAAALPAWPRADPARRGWHARHSRSAGPADFATSSPTSQVCSPPFKAFTAGEVIIAGWIAVPPNSRCRMRPPRPLSSTRSARSASLTARWNTPRANAVAHFEHQLAVEVAALADRAPRPRRRACSW